MKPSSKIYLIPHEKEFDSDRYYPANVLEVTVDSDGEIYLKLLSDCYESKDEAVRALRDAANQMEKVSFDAG
jgi:hypothetical protein